MTWVVGCAFVAASSVVVILRIHVASLALLVYLYRSAQFKEVGKSKCTVINQIA